MCSSNDSMNKRWPLTEEGGIDGLVKNYLKYPLILSIQARDAARFISSNCLISLAFFAIETLVIFNRRTFFLH